MADKANNNEYLTKKDLLFIYRDYTSLVVIISSDTSVVIYLAGERTKMKLNLYEDKNSTDERVDVYYSNMRPVIRQLIDTVNSDRPQLKGRPADEDLDDGEEIILDPKQIYYLDHIERKLFAYTRDGVYRVMDTLASCEEMLWNYGFVRVSKSNLINIYKITQLKPDLNMKVYASFDNGERICINRSYKKSFTEYLQRMRRMSE